MGNNQSSSSSSSPTGHGSRSRSTTTSSHHGGGPSTLTSRSSSPPRPLELSNKIVDGGALEPLSHLFATSQQDYSRPVVHRLIEERRLAPFHLGLDDFEDEWSIQQIMEAIEESERQAYRKLVDAHAAAIEQAIEAETTHQTIPVATRKSKDSALAVAQAVMHRERLAEIIKHHEHKSAHRSPNHQAIRYELAQRYQGRAVECPICFLYYPPPMVHTRCCDQPICTECFVQIKRAEPTATHLESEPAACPFCMEPNFGCIYTREPTNARPSAIQNDSNESGSSFSVVDGVTAKPKPRRKSFAHTEKSVVTTDQLHPDWEVKLEAVRATVARRANRRIVFRQVGDRLIPVGITSGRAGDGAMPTMSAAQLPPGFAAQVAAAMDAGSSGRGSRSSRRRNQEMAEMLAGLGGQDIEELMIEEAMRISMLEDEERQRKDREEKEKAEKALAQATGAHRSTMEAETSAQGATRVSFDSTSRTPVNSRSPVNSPPLSPIQSSRMATTTSQQMSDAIDAPMGNLSLGPPKASTTSSSTSRSTTTALPPAAHAAPPTLSMKPTSSTSTATAAPSSNVGLQGGTALAPTASTASSFSATMSDISSTEGYQPLEDDGDDPDEQSTRSSSQSGRLIDV